MSFSSRPSVALTSGLSIVDGELFIFDDSRSKNISVNRQTLSFGRKPNTDSGYLEFADSGSNGAPMTTNGLITKVVAQSLSGDFLKGFEIHINGAVVSTFSYPGTLSYEDSTLDLDFLLGDNVEIFVISIGSGIKSTKVILETAWRL